MNKTDYPNLEAEWDRLGQLPDEQIDLLDAAMLVARDEYPELDPDRCRVLLDEHADALAKRIGADSGVEDRLKQINQFLFEELGFAGNHEEFYDPRNSYLNDVLERRLGIPISLGLVQIELARRLDVPLEGVSFPGHFLVRLPLEDGLIVLDPYHRGRSIGADELRRRATPHLGEVEPDDDQLLGMLEPASPRAIVVRMLRNLRLLYQQARQPDKALRCADRLVRLLPDDLEALRDRGLLYSQVGHNVAAQADLSRYLQLAPNGPDADLVRSSLIDSQRAATRLH